MKAALLKTLLVFGAGFGTSWVLVHSPKAQEGEPAPLVVTTQLSAQRQPATVEPAPEAAPLALPTAVSSQPTAPAHWAQLESEDYRTYIQNLRAFGCPERTIADIIIADVHALYEARRQQACLPAVTNFWQAGFGQNRPDLAAVQALDQEEQAVLEALLGRAARPAEPEAAAPREDLWLEGLPAAKRATVAAVWNQCEAEQRSLADKMAAGTCTEAEMARFGELDQQKAEQLQKLLTPEEWEQYELCNSVTAVGLRNGLEGCEVTEAEFRDLFRLTREYEAVTQADSRPEGGDGDLGDFWQAYKRGVRQLLGEERYASFAQIKGLVDLETASVALAGSDNNDRGNGTALPSTPETFEQ